MKRINKADYERLQRLNAKICEQLQDPEKQSMTLFRGDMRAIQWAAWWIRESVKAAETRGQ